MNIWKTQSYIYDNVPIRNWALTTKAPVCTLFSSVGLLCTTYLHIVESVSAHWGQPICTMCTTRLHIAYLPSEDAAGRSSGRQAKGVWPSHHNASFPLPIWHRVLQTAWLHITHTFWRPAGDKQHAPSCNVWAMSMVSGRAFTPPVSR